MTAVPPLLPLQAALFLDFDGTLAEIASRPEAVTTPPGLAELLTRLQRSLHDAVAVVTGRPLEVVHSYLHPAQLHGAGLHGAELSLRGRPPRLNSFDLSPLAEVLRTSFGDDQRLILEDKRATVALHFRLAPERAAECIEAMQRHALPLGLEIIHGKAVVEACPPGINKGWAIAQLMAEPPFAGRQPVFVGDDATDEDGFAYVAATGGTAVKVGAAPSRAPFYLADVTAVYTWLEDSLQHMEQPQ